MNSLNEIFTLGHIASALIILAFVGLYYASRHERTSRKRQ